MTEICEDCLGLLGDDQCGACARRLCSECDRPKEHPELGPLCFPCHYELESSAGEGEGFSPVG